MAAQFCYLMFEKFPLLNQVKYTWVENLIKRHSEIEFLGKGEECNLEDGAIILTGSIFKDEKKNENKEKNEKEGDEPESPGLDMIKQGDNIEAV